MATIPVYQRRVAQDGGAPVTRVSGADPIGNALQNIGQVGQRAAEGFMAENLRQQEEAKRKAEQDAENEGAVQVANVLSQGEVYWKKRAIERAQGWKVGDEDYSKGLGEEFDKWVQDSAKTLNAPGAKRYMLQHGARMRAGLMTDAYDYQRKATSAKLDEEEKAGLAADEILISENWRDVNKVNELTARRLEPLMARTDLSEADKIKRANFIKQRAYLARERAFVENDPQGWLRENGSRRRPAVGTPTGEAPFENLFSAVISQESGGVHTTADGTLLTSPKGAQGITQVMPKTGTDPGYGVKPLQNQSREEYLRFGRDYLQAMLKEFDGDQAKALAAYNAGPGRVMEAVRSKGADWLSVMPQETKDYVKSIGKKAGLTEAAEPAPGGQDLVPSGMAAKLDPDSVYQLRSLAETRVGQMQSQLRAEGQRLVSDLLAAHKDGKVEAQPLGREYFDRAFGAEGDRLYGEYQQSRVMGSDIASYRAKPADQIVAEITASEPQAGEGYAAADARQTARKQAAAQVLQERNKDPVTYAASTSPRVKSLMQQLEATQDPQQRAVVNAQLIEASLAEQTRLGVQAQRVLTPAQADRWQSIAMNAKRPEDSANLIATLETEYGKFFPMVFNELAREGKISGELLIIPNLPSQAAREAVSRLARIKESDLTASVPNDIQKEVKDLAEGSVANLARTMIALTPQAVGSINSYASTIRKMAYEMVNNGDDPDTAVEKATQNLLGHYEMKGTVRFPQGVNPISMQQQMNKVLAGITEVDVEPDQIGRRRPDEARAAYAEIVKSRPLWHTTDDDKGVQLFVVRENGTKAPVTINGSPVKKTWVELQAKAMEATAKSTARTGKMTVDEGAIWAERARLFYGRQN